MLFLEIGSSCETESTYVTKFNDTKEYKMCVLFHEIKFVLKICITIFNLFNFTITFIFNKFCKLKTKSQHFSQNCFRWNQLISWLYQGNGMNNYYLPPRKPNLPITFLQGNHVVQSSVINYGNHMISWLYQGNGTNNY